MLTPDVPNAIIASQLVLLKGAWTYVSIHPACADLTQSHCGASCERNSNWRVGSKNDTLHIVIGTQTLARAVSGSLKCRHIMPFSPFLVELVGPESLH